MYWIVGDKGEVIRRCKTLCNVHPKSYGNIVFRSLQSAAVIAAREEEGGK